MAEAIKYELRNAAAWVTINRPEARNALSLEVREGLREALVTAEADERVAAIVLTGAGNRAFCAGGDLKEMSREGLRIPPPDFIPQPGRNLQIATPIIAAVNGVAFGGGFLLAQCADLVVAAASAQFGITEARVGRGAPWAAPLPWLIPPRVAMELLLTAAPISAQRALEVGLVNRVVPDEDLVEACDQLVEVIAANAPLSVRAAKEMVYSVAGHDRDEAFERAEQIWAPVYLSDDAQEGTRAFVEKRTPVWKGE